MRSGPIIIDAGPIVAFLNKRDQYNKWSKSQFARLNPPFLTCESVISETCFLLRRIVNGPQKVLELLDRKLIQIPFKLDVEISRIEKLMRKYDDVPMSLADACLVRMSDQIADSTICTLDSDFRIYRKDNRKVIPLIIP